MSSALDIAEAEDDTSLALTAQQGDSEAFIVLYDRYYDRIERYARSRVTSAPEVEDLISTTFLHALTHIERYDPRKGRFSTWLFAIARNAVRNHHRREGRPSADTEISPNPLADPQYAALSREAAQQLRAVVSQLTRDQQDALALRYGADLAFADIAVVLGKSEPAAKMLVQRALNILCKRLPEESYS